jgi:hypothetical protein
MSSFQQAHRGRRKPTLTQRIEKRADKIALAFAWLGLGYCVLRVFI